MEGTVNAVGYISEVSGSRFLTRIQIWAQMWKAP